MAETSTIFGFMKYVSATDILSDFKKTVDGHFVNSLERPFLLEGRFCVPLILIYVLTSLKKLESVYVMVMGMCAIKIGVYLI